MFRRRRKDGAEASPSTVTIDRQPERIPDFEGTFEELLDEIETLSDSADGNPPLDAQRRLLALRHQAGIRLVDTAPPDPSFAVAAADLPDGDPLPEFTLEQLTPGAIRAGILRNGCVLVRGLVPRQDALALADGIDAAFAERERVEANDPKDPGLYEPFVPTERYGGEVFGRPWIKQGGGLLAADSPRLNLQMMRLFSQAKLGELVSSYLGEPALISVHKTTLRKADPSVPGAWHQDGFFMGPVRSLNLWLSLSRCGDEAPGLDIVPRRLEHYVATATEEAALNYTISQQKVEQAAGDTPVIRPIFEPGDALLFDELFLHQTGSDPSMPNPRYAVENWFFAGSAFPDEYAPVAV
jgi:Phytanoyl-CoA dioxygenase (PhyH)